MMDWSTKQLYAELQLKETVKDVKFLHNDTMFAVAQKKYTFIYDKAGVEIHRMKRFVNMSRLEFLHYHFLLAATVRDPRSSEQTGSLRFPDVPRRLHGPACG